MKKVSRILKALSLSVLVASMALSMCACAAQQTHTHNWKDATCTEPQVCTDCGETNGSAKGCQYETRTCVVCGRANPSTEDIIQAIRLCKICTISMSSAVNQLDRGYTIYRLSGDIGALRMEANSINDSLSEMRTFCAQYKDNELADLYNACDIEALSMTSLSDSKISAYAQRVRAAMSTFDAVCRRWGVTF